MMAEVPDKGNVAYSIADLRQTHVCEFRMVPTGDYTVNRNGRRVPVMQGIEYIPTACGKLPESEWARLMEAAIEREGKRDLLARIIEHCRVHCAWIRKDEERKVYAMDCLSSGAYKHWKDFEEEKT